MLTQTVRGRSRVLEHTDMYGQRAVPTNGLTLNIRGMTPKKWNSIQDLDIFTSLDFILLTEHFLSA